MKAEATDMDIEVVEMSVIKVEEATDTDIKQEEISVVKFEELLVDTKEEDFPRDVTCPTIKAEHDQVSYICVCPLVDTFYEYPRMCTIIYLVGVCPCEQIKQLHCGEWKHFCRDLNPRSSSTYPSCCTDYASP
jgi:hypothetical protein